MERRSRLSSSELEGIFYLDSVLLTQLLFILSPRLSVLSRNKTMRTLTQTRKKSYQTQVEVLIVD